MTDPIPGAGAAGAELARKAHDAWAQAAARAGLDLAGFDPHDPLEARLAWARARGLQVGAVLARFSSKLQHSTEAQVLDCVAYAAAHGLYVPPEFLCVDEAVSGRKARRDGLDRIRALLQAKRAAVLLVFKVSRLFRVAYKGFQFFQEEVVDEGLRAVSVSQGIDTADQRTWRQLTYLHGIMDELLLSTIADHVLAGLMALFRRGYVTAALPVGYRRVEVPGAPPTNRGRPRTVPGLVPGFAERLLRHARWHLDGMPIAEGHRRWVADGGPCDPRSKLGRMTCPAYRRMLANPRYIGRWAFGRHRNVWSHKRDYMRKMPRPETEVLIVQCEDLRALDDETFFALQARLDGLKTGPRGPRKRRDLRLCNLVTDCFSCGRCGTRFYQVGSKSQSMQCKHGTLCPALAHIRRDEAVRAVCAALVERLRADDDLIARVAGRAAELDADGDDGGAERERAERAVAALDRRIEDLLELAGEGSDADRAALKARVRAAQADRAAARAECARLRRARDGGGEPITPDRVRAALKDLGRLLEDGAAGRLGPDLVYRAAAAFRRAVGGRIRVEVEARPGRQRAYVRGAFRPALIGAARAGLGDGGPDVGQGDGDGDGDGAGEVVVWLRPLPQKDRLAEEVHQLIDVQGLSYRDAADVMRRRGHQINSGVVWQIYHRYYEMLGHPVPPRPYNNGRPRKRRGTGTP